MSGDERYPDLALMVNLPARKIFLDDDRNSHKDEQLSGARSTGGRCQLLALPTEIRIEIYRHLFREAELLTDALRCLYCFPSWICACCFPWQITSTCRQLRDEATSYLLSATTLQIQGTMNATFQLQPSLVSAIPRVVVQNTVGYWKQQPLDLEKFHGLKTLELRNVTVWCKYHDEAYLQSAEGDDCMIQLAFFNLNRIHPDLKRICAVFDRSFEILLWCQYVVSSSTHETIHAVIDVDKQVVLRKFKGPANRDRNAWAGFY